jgi:hypothetical protein
LDENVGIRRKPPDESSGLSETVAIHEEGGQGISPPLAHIFGAVTAT